jgi:YD repeat-containing protein
VSRTFNGYTTANGYATTDVEYDLMGRPLRVSNPYYSSGTAAAVTPQTGPWTINTYDPLDRVTSVSFPGGGVTSSEYAGRKIAVTDQAGRRRRQFADALGRVTELHEPDASGNLGPDNAPAQATQYAYDTLNNLIKITQGAQTRYFKYDSLSRLTHERQVEQAAPHYLPDPLTGNDYWSHRLLYNGQGLVTDAYDARNVHTQLAYDGLNRVSQISYAGETGGRRRR